MTKIDELVELLAEVDDHCANTFCNTCPYQHLTSGEYPCSYAIAQKLIDEGYDKKKTVVEEFAEKLKERVLKFVWKCNIPECIFNDIIIDLLKEYGNE